LLTGTGKPHVGAAIKLQQGASHMASKNTPEQPRSKPASSGQAPKQGELEAKDLDKVAGGRPAVIGRKGELTE
jgi:hypothetical protein